MTDKKSYIGEEKEFIVRQPLTLGNVLNYLRERFDLDETKSDRIIIEEKLKVVGENTNQLKQ